MGVESGSASASAWRSAPDVVVERMDGSALLINLKTNRMFELDSTGARLWDLLTEGLDVDAITAQLHREYDVDASVLAREVEGLLRNLESEQLVVHDESG
jgi:coenzyme PQQ synthesis protein D (PqqD)